MPSVLVEIRRAIPAVQPAVAGGHSRQAGGLSRWIRMAHHCCRRRGLCGYPCYWDVAIIMAMPTL